MNHSKIIEETFGNENFDQDVKDYIIEMVNYNISDGRKFRLFFLEYTIQILRDNVTLDENLMNKLEIIGYCIELLQAYYLIVDDKMDNSQNRRGKLSWHEKVTFYSTN